MFLSVGAEISSHLSHTLLHQSLYSYIIMGLLFHIHSQCPILQLDPCSLKRSYSCTSSLSCEYDILSSL